MVNSFGQINWFKDGKCKSALMTFGIHWTQILFAVGLAAVGGEDLGGIEGGEP